MERDLNKIRWCSWNIVLVCAAGLICMMIALPETELVRTSERDERIQKIEATTDVRQLRGEATTLVLAGASTSTTARVLGTLSIGTFIICIVSATIALKNARKLERDQK